MSNFQHEERNNTGFLKRFVAHEAAGGVLLMIVAAAGLVIANSPLAPRYFGTLHSYIGGLSVLHWVNDALMAVFFLLVGLEVKREVLQGQLATWSQRLLPEIPAVFFFGLNLCHDDSLQGGTITAATDIAFAPGILSLNDFQNQPIHLA